MAQIATYEDITPDQIIRNRGNDEDHPSADVYPFIGKPGEKVGANAFLVRYIPGTTSSTHYHTSDQMQIIVEGKGRLGHHAMTPYQVHFSRAYTPYGPLLPDAGEGWAFVNLRTRPDPGGAQRLSVARDKLLQVADRRPFQVSCPVSFPQANGQAAWADIAGLSNEEGLHGVALTLPAHGKVALPSPAQSDGQYIVVIKGNLVTDGKTRNALAIIHLTPDEPPFELQAGDKGLEAMVVKFPRLDVEAPQAKPEPVSAGDKVWSCLLCDFMYDEAAGMPDEGISPGTRWADVPETWTCPDCGAVKSDFVMAEF